MAYLWWLQSQRGQDVTPTHHEDESPLPAGTQARSGWSPRQGSVGTVRTQFLRLAETDGSLHLESGQTLENVTIAYETYGTLNAERSNAILVAHDFSGDAHAA